MKSFFKANKKNIFLTAAIVLVIIIGAVASYSVFYHSDLSRFYTKDGAFEANLSPDNTVLFAQFSNAGTSQRTNLQKIWEAFPKNQEAGNLDTFLNDNLSTYGLNYKQDIQPLWGESSRVSLSVAPDMNTPENNDVLVTFAVNDPAKAMNLFDRLSSQTGFFKENLDDAVLVGNSEANLYLTIYKDLVLASSSRDVLRNTLDRANKHSLSLVDSDGFKQQFINKYPDNFMFVYLNPGQSQKASSIAQLNDLKLSEFFALSAEKEGILISAYMKADGKTTASDTKSYKNGIGLMKNVSVDGLIAYFETPNFIKFLHLEDAQAMPSIDQLSSAVQGYLGLDLKKDILTWMDKGLAISLSSQDDSIIPGVNLLVDASSNVDGAKNLVARVDGQLDGVLTLVKTQFAGYGDIVSKQTEEVKDGLVHRLKLDLSKVPDEVFQAFSQLPDSLKKESVNLNYGLIAKNILLISTFNNLEIQDPLSDDVNFKLLLDKIDGYENGVLYVIPANVAPLADQLIALNSQMSGPLTEEEQLGYGYFKQYVTLFKGVIFGNKMISDNEIEAKGFVEIGL
ncbi:MAG: hypothetical protein UR28_C0017G0025 [Candidatus Peregrinibacteria bacterium GW2011_GWF2_33_10]|nr:MAG: hypothetical protein UR28_C0017G0025 [Candidatus Peregrinibacteria bacterium GW2011_GWF2_33_10]OGJ44577.1 MAG: hypothetical protein A2263_02610 [Candidatus Peregrinibacteria bacterium RIFOXYA2_FULL_33_21]OGJ44883.1 MAG: hypothetical protein A2272_01920 [Candidatus Peregrinibacteria bacterium RIFOXYA12_FULL_33_12]OGJ50036.1 MAG: hypothetical protein A2307_01370 [Candidatus Peregrinibacteria bacterium RIFOXYB2_FULL_33_20]